ncbi:HlyD family efflux transporter periplasmic adaptor subunit [Algiphilus sp.]|uniref:efflux RND transporter periplasmic adaptor subunit n=1 Tax=Algiphilus sp. TaxID=1872431 RepID=UPI0032EF1279
MAKTRQRFRRILPALLTLGLLGFFAYAFWPKPVPVDIGAVTRGPMALEVREDGHSRVRDVYVVSAPVSGRLVRIEGDPGDVVTAGATVLFRLRPSDPAFLDARSQRQAEAAVRSARAALALAKAEAAKANAQLRFARAEVERARQLQEKGSYSGAALERAELELATARAAEQTAVAAIEVRAAELQNAEAVLATAPADGKDADRRLIEIVAPVDGCILRLLQQSESFVQAGVPLLELGNPEEQEIVVDVLSRDAVRIAAGALVRMGGWGGAAPLMGRVRRVEPSGFTKVSALGIEEQRVNVVIDVTSPRSLWRSMGHGFRVDAAITVWQAEDVVRVPTSALFRHEGDWAVFAVEDGRARRTPLTIGKNNGEMAEVRAGIAAGARVVLHPSERIDDGIALTRR